MVIKKASGPSSIIFDAYTLDMYSSHYSNDTGIHILHSEFYQGLSTLEGSGGGGSAN